MGRLRTVTKLMFRIYSVNSELTAVTPEAVTVEHLGFRLEATPDSAHNII